MASTPLAEVPAADPTVSGPDLTPRFDAGDTVEVRRRLDDKWARGFEIVAADDDGYRLRRLSDGVEIPATFAGDDVRKERKRDFWWY